MLVELTQEVDSIDRRFTESFKEDPLLRNIDAGSLTLSVHESSIRISSELSDDLNNSQRPTLRPKIR